MIFSRLFSTRHWSFESASFWSLIATIVLAVIAFIPLSAVPFLYTKVSLLAFGAIVTFIFYVLARLTRGNIVAPPLSLIGAIWLVPLAYGVSTIFSSTTTTLSVFGNSLETDTLGFMIIAGTLGTLFALIARNIKQYKSVLKAGAWLIGFVLIAQIIILILGSTLKWINPSVSIVGSFADLATLAGLGVVMTLLALRFVELSSRTKTFLGLMVIVELFFIMLANTQLVWVLVGLVAFGVFVEGVMRRVVHVSSEESLEVEDDDEYASLVSEKKVEIESDANQTSIGIPLLVLAVSIFFVIGGSTVANVFDNSLRVNTSSVRPSWQSTITVGQNTYQNNAVFGSGPNTFGQQWLAFRNADINTTPFWNTDFTTGVGIVPTSFVTTGIVGMIAWIVLVGLLLFLGLRALIMREVSNPEVRAVAIVTFVGALYLILQLIFSVPNAVIVALTFVLIGIFASTLRFFEPRTQWGVAFAQSPRVGFVIVFVLTLLLLASVGGAYVVVERYVAQVDLVRAENAISMGDIDTAMSATAQSLLFVRSDRAYRMEAIIGMARITKILNNKNTKPTNATRQQLQALVSQSVAVATVATNLNPSNYQNWYVLGSVYKTVVPLNVPDAYTKAQEAYKKAEKLNPTNAVILLTRARLATMNKSYSDAETLLHKAISLKPDYTRAIFLLSQIDVQLGKAKEALKEAENASYFVPNDPTVLFQVGVLREETGDFNGAISALLQAVTISPKYANTRYFLAIAYAHQNKYSKAIAQLEVIAKSSKANAKAVAKAIAMLKDGNNPFPVKSSAKTAVDNTTLPALSGK